MIPKVAHFYWYGDGPLPALRQASVDSFQRLNPDWQFFIHRSGEKPDATLRERIVRSDAARYGILYRAGGIYFDTDIVFMRPIPDAWLEADVLLPALPHGEMYGLHVLGCVPGSVFFKYAINLAEMRMESSRALGCQSLGVPLWEKIDVQVLADSMRLNAVLVPMRAFLSVGWRNVEDLWSPGVEIDRSAIGLHWYGGDPLSRDFEHCSKDELPDCMVRSALEATHVAH